MNESVFVPTDMEAVWCVSQEAVHFEMIDYSQNVTKKKEKRNQIYNKLKRKQCDHGIYKP